MVTIKADTILRMKSVRLPNRSKYFCKYIN